jgi:hypothetical protein
MRQVQGGTAGKMKQWLTQAGAVDIEEISVDMILGAGNSNPELVEPGASSTAGAMVGLVMYQRGSSFRFPSYFTSIAELT